MKWLARVFASAVVRRLAVLLVGAVLLWCGVGKAHAQQVCSKGPNVQNADCPDRPSAYAAAVESQAFYAGQWGTPADPSNCVYQYPGGTTASYRCYYVRGDGTQLSTVRYYPVLDECPDGSAWDEATHQCEVQCSAKPSYYAGFFQSASAGMKQCNAGCVYELQSDDSTKLRVDGPANSIFAGRGMMAPTGAKCSAEPNVPDRTPESNETCADTAGGYQVCFDNKGRQCVRSPASGRRYCAKLGDAQNATSPDRTENIRKSVPSDSPGTDPGKPTNRQGEDWQKKDSVTTTNVNNNTTSTTNINGNNGTPNTTPGSGVPDDGSDDPGEGKGDEEDEGDKGDVAGGANCANPPSVVGDVRQIEYMATLRDWTSLCEGLDSLGPEFADARANAEAALAELHGNYVGELLTSSVEGRWADEVNAILGGKGQHATGGEGENSFRRTEEIKFDQLDGSGFLGGGACPSLPSVRVEGTDIGFPMDNVCEFLSRIGLLVEALAYLLAARILTGSK